MTTFDEIMGPEPLPVVNNNMPIHLQTMIEETGVDWEDAVEFFQRYFGGYEEYQKICQDPAKLARKLAIAEEHIDGMEE